MVTPDGLGAHHVSLLALSNPTTGLGWCRWGAPTAPLAVVVVSNATAALLAVVVSNPKTGLVWCRWGATTSPLALLTVVASNLMVGLV